MLAADYSQIELRIMAHLSGDDGLVRRLPRARIFTAQPRLRCSAVPPDQVTADQRRSAKAINFGLIYGMSAFGLASNWASIVARRRLMSSFTSSATRVSRPIWKAPANWRVARVMWKRCSAAGLYLPDISARNAQRRQAAERTAINAPMQGTAADIIKKAMLHVAEWINIRGKRRQNDHAGTRRAGLRSATDISSGCGNGDPGTNGISRTIGSATGG